MASLTAFAVGATIAGAATVLNQSGQAKALDVPLVAGYNAANNQARQNNDEHAATPTATALSGAPSGTGTPTSPGTSTSSPTTSSSTTTPTSTSSQAPAQPPATQQPPQQTSQPDKQAPGSPNAAFAARVVELVNQVRQGSCKPLQVDSRLTTAAQGHATDMAQRKYFSHDTPEGVKFDQRIKAAGYERPAAENIAQGQRTPEQVMQSWMQSDGHRRNIMNCSYTTIGVAVDTNGFYWVQDFGF
jgi:uncharacterized protein YkwD